MSAFLEYLLKPTAQKIKSYIKDTNDVLRKLDALPSLPEDILCTIDVVSLSATLVFKLMKVQRKTVT